MSETFRDLIARQKSMAFLVDIDRVTDTFPARERFRLVDPLCRASIAIPSDLAEGKGRISKKEFLQMTAGARGSSYEVQTQASYKLGYLADAEFDELLEKASEISRLLNGLIKNLQNIEADAVRPPKTKELPTKSRIHWITKDY